MSWIHGWIHDWQKNKHIHSFSFIIFHTHLDDFLSRHLKIVQTWTTGDLQRKISSIHGDFDTSNILVDPDTFTVTGIIDFEEGHIYDPAADFLFFDESDHFLRAAKKYETISSPMIVVRRSHYTVFFLLTPSLLIYYEAMYL